MYLDGRKGDKKTTTSACNEEQKSAVLSDFKALHQEKLFSDGGFSVLTFELGHIGGSEQPAKLFAELQFLQQKHKSKFPLQL